MRNTLFLLVALNAAAVLLYLFFSSSKSEPSTRQTEATAKPRIILKSATTQPGFEWMENTKFVLFWNRMWDSRDFFFGADGYELFKHCAFKNCFATHRKVLPVEDFHAVVFHAAQYNEQKHGRPEKRRPHQRYIFATLEPPTRAYPDNLRKFGEFFNWTMTYRSDSDIVRPYGYVVHGKQNYTPPSYKSIKNRPHLAAWFVSNCYTINRRQEVYKNLRPYINIDVYGSCGTLKCAKDKKIHESAKECYDVLEKNYKFYLSFENAHCKDYVTEKLYRVLERDVVPVVYGYADYWKIAPPHSVIVADNYPSPEALGNYLVLLDRDIEEYKKFFEWKKSYRVARDFNRTVCQLCKMLNNPKQPRKVYKDIYTWWLGKNHEYCMVGDTLPVISESIY